MTDYAPIRVTPEVGERLRAASFELSTKLGRRITYGETVNLALDALGFAGLDSVVTKDSANRADEAVACTCGAEINYVEKVCRRGHGQSWLSSDPTGPEGRL
jgi:hypothetical protein